MKYIKTYGYSVYLGIACDICGITVDDWRFWVIYLPTVILVVWKSDAKGEEQMIRDILIEKLKEENKTE